MKTYKKRENGILDSAYRGHHLVHSQSVQRYTFLPIKFLQKSKILIMVGFTKHVCQG